MPMHSFTLTDRASGDIFPDVLGDAVPRELSSNKVKGLIAALMASRRAVVEGFQKLGPERLLFRYKNAVLVAQ
jgi:hypothetical protein